MITLLASLALFLQDADKLPLVSGAEIQPVRVHVGRLKEALDFLGQPVVGPSAEKLEAALKEADGEKSLRGIQEALDPLCLAGVHINPESRVKVEPGPAARKLMEQGWSQFLVKVHNEAGVTTPLRATSPQALSMFNSPKEQIEDRWMELKMFDDRPLQKTLAGIRLEYRIIQIYSRDAGKRAAVMSFDVGQGSQDLGFRNDVTLTFEAAASVPLTFRVKDTDETPTTAGFLIKDPQGRVYPSQAKRRRPDFAFHPQVYRGDGESIRLPKGTYTVECARGPEYLPETRTITIGADPATAEFSLRRWTDPSKLGWWSGDHHIHASGCAHYERPEEGVFPPDMLKHILGEDLKVGATLTWGPGFDFQKQFFTGKTHKVSTYPYLIRYDVEVSGFGSHQSGHLCLLRLKDQMYPGGESKTHWPTLCLNTLKWAKRQGAVCGPAHSGWGLGVQTEQLPTYEVPPFDSIGAIEYIVDVTHEVPGPDGKPVPAVDFLSHGDTPYVWEHNIWYHTLNAGFRTRISGETDFPCIYGERVGLGRSYVKLDGKLDYDLWCEGIRLGRNYVSDGRSHLIDFSVGGVEVGTKGSELRLDGPEKKVTVLAKVSAMLPEKRDPAIRPYADVIGRAGGKGSKWAAELKPFWHIERARIDETRNVKVEIIVNGYPAGSSTIVADGSVKELKLLVPIERSSWVALRILGSSHTNPVFVVVGDKPIRASKRSVEWCLKSVEQCWSQKERLIAPAEKQDAIDAYEHARKVYRRLLGECESD
ncbi:MAG: CehA/McbA family metallohydrolase [Planctomycetes bacterium]|nr:CehA/McbA family metallohydrolase [Planctomycetota bacterium]